MAFTTAQLTLLEAAYAGGVLTVKHGDKLVTYGSMSELWTAIERLKAALANPRRRATSVLRYTRHA